MRSCVVPLVGLMVAIAGCVGPGRDVVELDRAFIRAFPEHPVDADLAGHYGELRYLAWSGDPGAIRAVLLWVTSDHRVHHIATSACPFESTEDLEVAAYDGGLDGIFWTTLAGFSPQRQSRAIAHFSYLRGRRDSGGISLHSMVDFEDDRDAFLVAHPAAIASGESGPGGDGAGRGR